jgi:hypothetical protein
MQITKRERDKMLRRGSRRKNVIRNMGIIFALVGAVILIIGIVFAVRGVFSLVNTEKTTAVLMKYQPQSDSDEENNVYGTYGYFFNYTVDGVNYKNIPVPYYSTEHHEGKRITIYYDPQDPESVTTGTWAFFGCFITLPMAFMFLCIGLPIIIVNRARERRKKKLLETGQRITAQVIDVSINYNLHVGGMRPRRLECVYEDPSSGKRVLFQSENLWYNPSVLLDEKEVSVYVDRDNYKKYYVDVRYLQESIVDYR